MKTACVVAAVASLGCASAFVAPSSFAGSAVQTVARTSSAMKMSVEDMNGASVETGGECNTLALIAMRFDCTSLHLASSA
jgi:hypothetical protein